MFLYLADTEAKGCALCHPEQAAGEPGNKYTSLQSQNSALDTRLPFLSRSQL